MDVQMPDGTIISGVPDNATQADVGARYSAYLTSLQPAKEASVLGEAAKSVEEMGSAYQTALGTLTGDPVAAVRAGRVRGEALERKYGTTRGLKEAGEAYDNADGGVRGVLAATGETLSQVPQAVAGQTANLATMAAMSRLGATVGASVGTAAIPIPVLGTVTGAAIGGFGAAVLSQFVPFYQENLDAQLKEQEARKETPDLNRASAAAVAVMQGSTEVAAKVFALGGALVSKIVGSKPAQQAEKALVEAAQRSLATAAGRSLPGAVGMGGVRALGVELPTEMAQGIMTRAQAGQSLTDEDALNEYKNTIFETIKVAGAIGSAAGPLNRSAARSEMRAQGLTPEGAPLVTEMAADEKAVREEEQQSVGYMRAQRDEREAVKAENAPFIGQKETPEGQFGLNLLGGKRVTPSETLQGAPLPERGAGVDAYGRPKEPETPTPATTPTSSAPTPITQALDTTQPTQQHRDEIAALAQRLTTLPDTPSAKPLRAQINGRIKELTALVKTADSVPVGTQGALPIVPSAGPTDIAAPELTTPVPPAAPAPSTSALVKAAGIPASAPVAQQLKKLDLTQQADRTAAVHYIAAALANPNVQPGTKTAIQAFYDQHISQAQPEEQGDLDLSELQPLAQSAPPPEAPVAPATPIAPAVPAAPTPATAPSVLGLDVWNALGIGPTAIIRKSADINGLDFAQPKDSAMVRQVLELYRSGSKSERIKANIDTYLARFPVIDAPVAETPEAPVAPPTPVEQRVTEDQIAPWAGVPPRYKGTATVVYTNNNIGLLRVSTDTGVSAYYPVTPGGSIRVDVANISPNQAAALRLSEQDVEELREARVAIEAREHALLAQTPDGPFTDATNNVVSTENVDPRYTQYLTALMQKLGMGDVNVFLIAGNDLKGNKSKYHLASDYGNVELIGDTDRAGTFVPFGPAQDAFAIHYDPTMSEGRVLETLAHELGHGIERAAFAHAPAATQNAVVAEYLDWKTAAQTMTREQFINSMSNRNTSAALLAPQSPQDLASPASTLRGFDSYWTSFPEWFADNVSRWTSTDAKATSLTAKFFQALAKQLRALVQAITGAQFAPASTVAEFLNAMGPGNPVVWRGAIADAAAEVVTAQPALNAAFVQESKNAALSPEFSAEASLVDPQQVANSGIVQTAGAVNTPVGQITPATWASINQAKSQTQRTALTQFAAVQAQNDTGWIDWFRQRTVDTFAPLATRLGPLFDKGVRNSLGDINPVQFIRQAYDHARIALDVFRRGGLRMNRDGFWESYTLKDSNDKEMSAQQVVKEIADIAKKNNEAFAVTKAKVATVLEGMRLFDLRAQNAVLEKDAQTFEAAGEFDAADKAREKKFLLHMRYAEIDALEQAFRASPELQEIQRIMNTSRESVVDAMIASGRISQERGDFWKSVTNYVPFDRENNVFEDISLTQRPTRKGIASLGELPKLRGSMTRPVVNTIDNYMNTMAWMVDQSMRNSAAVRTLNLMASTGVDLATKLPSLKQASNTHMVIPKLYENGEPVYFEVFSPYYFASFVQAPEIQSSILKMLGASSRVLRTTITAMPQFAVAQVIMDAQRAMFLSGVKNPAAVLGKTLYNFPIEWFGAWFGRRSDTERKLTSLGVIGEYDLNPLNPIETLEYQTGAKPRGGFKRAIHMLEQVTKASDMSARMAVYDQTLKETGDAGLAVVRARELINFNRRGSSKAMGVLTHTVPFFNAYAQGLDLVYRGVSGKDSSTGLPPAAARKYFASVTGSMMAMGLLYAWAMADDEAYVDLTDEVRDRNWILPKWVNEAVGLDFTIKLPVPTEFGFVFKSIPERIVSHMRAAAKNEDQGVGHAVADVFTSALKSYSNVPIPPVIKSAIENTANYSFFTHRDLVPKAMQERPAALQYTSNTSEIAKAIGQTADVSPIKVDNWLRGTFGLMGASSLLFTDAMMNPERPDRSLAQIPFLSIALVNPAGSRVKDEFYAFRQQITEAVAAKNMLEKENPAKYAEFVQKNYHLLAAAPYINQKLKLLSEYRAMKTMITSIPTTSMSAADKRQRLDEINNVEKIILGDMRTMRKAIQDAGPK